MPKKAASQTPPSSFEDALRQLEQILADIEGGDVGLEESLVKYERGNFLIQYCRTVLTSAEKQIEALGKEASSEESDGGGGSEETDA
jgi:exodeoxyribonuclease VII small subunit